MRLLLDTHLLLWAAASSKRLPRDARRTIEDPANEVYFSAASVWEIAIKISLRRKDFHIDLATLLQALPEMGMTELLVSAAHAARVSGLPQIHRDPFDRLLIAQSIAEPLTLLTNDALLVRYGDHVQVV